MTRIFISYSSKNRKQAKAVQKSLEAAGLEVWRDQREIENDWSAEIAQGLTQADLVCLLWSKEAAESRWVKNEWLTARALEKLIVPCLFPDAPHLPVQIENMQGVQFLDTPSGLRDLVQHFERRTAFHWRSISALRRSRATFPSRLTTNLPAANRTWSRSTLS